MHCHVAWHTSEGFAVQFQERKSEMIWITTSGVLDADAINSSCTNWDKYIAARGVDQDDLEI